MTPIVPERKAVRRWLSRLGEPTLTQLLQLQRADTGGKSQLCEEDEQTRILALIAEIQAENACLHLKDLAVTGHDLMAMGYTGPAIGKALNALLEAVINEEIENSKQALLGLVATWRKD
jgi:tRNA nucleotidyltransferase (CCA-adding enzyme)